MQSPCPSSVSLLNISPTTITPSHLCLPLRVCHSPVLLQLVNRAAAKYDQMQLTSFLDAAANGDTDVVQDMLRQGMNPNSADYDGRTALMIAAYKGRKVGRGLCF